MLGYYDKFNLSAINAVTSDGKIIDFSIRFPIDEFFQIPEDIIQISIIEYHEGHEIYGYESFKICIGEITSIRQIVEVDNGDYYLDKKIVINIDNIDEKLCCYKKDGKKYVYSKVFDGDIVVSNIDEMKYILKRISDNYLCIKKSIADIKRFSEEKIEEYSYIDEETRNNRINMCKKLRKDGE